MTFSLSCCEKEKFYVLKEKKAIIIFQDLHKDH